jgi:endonuclease YncB( thermonuclease family)
MVEEDWAWWFRKYAPRDEELMLAEQAARNTKRGLWADPNPLAPWEWKNGK